MDAFVTHRATGLGMEKSHPFTDGVVTGWGKVDGRLVYVYAQDFTILILPNLPERNISRADWKCPLLRCHWPTCTTRLYCCCALTMALNSMVENLNGLVSRVRDSSRSLTSVTDKLHVAANQVARAAQTQKDEISNAHSAIITVDQSIARVGDGVNVLMTASQETSSAILEITASIDNVADTVEQLSLVVDEVAELERPPMNTVPAYRNRNKLSIE